MESLVSDLSENLCSGPLSHCKFVLRPSAVVRAIKSQFCFKFSRARCFKSIVRVDMKLRSLLIAAATILAVAVVVASEPILVTHKMAQGLSLDPDSGCVYVIFINAVKLHCRDTAPGPS